MSKLDLRPKESGLTAYLSQAVQERSGEAWKTEGVSGDQDWLVMLPGPRYGHLELKRKGERPKPHQFERLEAMRAKGAYVGWTDSKSGVDAFLAGLANQIPQMPYNAPPLEDWL